MRPALVMRDIQSAFWSKRQTTSSTLLPTSEDAIKKSVLSWDQVEEQLQPAANVESVKAALEFQERILKAGQPNVPPSLDDDIKASAFRTAAIGAMAQGAFKVFQARYDEIMKANTREHCCRRVMRLNSPSACGRSA